MPENVAAKDGHAVQWSTNRGTLDHNATATNASGIAANRIRSNTEGTGTITASYGGVYKSINVGFVAKPVSESRYDDNNYIAIRRVTSAPCLSSYDLFWWNGAYVSDVIMKSHSSPVTPSIVSGNYIYSAGREISRSTSGCSGPTYSPNGTGVLNIRYEIIQTPR